MDYPKRKIVFIGDSGVGKTSIITRFQSNDFLEGMPTSIGTSFISKNYQTTQGSLYTLNIYDTAGQERFDSLTSFQYRDADVIVIVYSIENRQSFEKLYKYKENINNTIKSQIPIIVAGNKNDLESRRKVTTDEAIGFANENNWEFFECSAKTNERIENLYDKIGELASSVSQDESIITQELVPNDDDENNKGEKKKCC